MEIYKFENVAFTYPNQALPAIKDISFTINQGDFVVFCGKSGSGKSTLLRQLKPILTPYGKRSGEIFLFGKPINNININEQVKEIGFVMQDIESQIVTDKVWHELAFGLENLGLSNAEIRIRVAETASFFGIHTWFNKSVNELSGGQKQLLNLASIMAMQPSVLILDEPTGQLDPLSASELLNSIYKLNRDLGITVILSEHNLEEIMPMANKVIVMEKGSILTGGTPYEVCCNLQNSDMITAMPTPARVFNGVKNQFDCPITVREGRIWLEQIAKTRSINKIIAPSTENNNKPLITLSDIYFRYNKNSTDVLAQLSATIYKNEICAILGGNGSGKTTVLSVIAGFLKPYRGKIKWHEEELSAENIGFMPQNPKSLFLKNTLREDINDEINNSENAHVYEVEEICELYDILDMHPYDLSGGEQQRAAIAKLLLKSPKLLLLDEPTKGMDAVFKKKLGILLQKLKQNGITIIIVSHDIEFCAEFADTCQMMFDGKIVGIGPARQFFANKSFYTTAANRMARSYIPNAVIAEDIITACSGRVKENITSEDTLPVAKKNINIAKKEKTSKSSIWKRFLGGAVSFAVFLLITIFFNNKLSDWGNVAVQIISVIALCMVLGFILPKNIEYQKKNKKKSSQRSDIIMGIALMFAVAVTIWAGAYFLHDRKYYFISLLIIFEIILSFLISFEGRRPTERELVIIAVLCALGTAGRTAFYMLPQIKPVVAIVILSGVCFGGQVGFLVGAITMLISNILFGQGPWTPWQMFALGLIGLISGLLFADGFLPRKKIWLSIFGFLSSIIIYGGIVNTASVLMVQGNPTFGMLISAYVIGFPFDLLLAASTAAFLWVLTDVTLSKLDRIKEKYGILK